MKVRVVGGANHDAIKLFAHLVEHFAIVAETLGRRMFFERTLRSFLVDINHCDQILRADATDIGGTPAADADTGEVQFFVGTFSRRDLACRGTVIKSHPGGSCGRGFEGVASRDM